MAHASDVRSPAPWGEPSRRTRARSVNSTRGVSAMPVCMAIIIISAGVRHAVSYSEATLCNKSCVAMLCTGRNFTTPMALRSCHSAAVHAQMFCRPCAPVQNTSHTGSNQSYREEGACQVPRQLPYVVRPTCRIESGRPRRVGVRTTYNVEEPRSSCEATAAKRDCDGIYRRQREYSPYRRPRIRKQGEKDREFINGFSSCEQFSASSCQQIPASCQRCSSGCYHGCAEGKTWGLISRLWRRAGGRLGGNLRRRCGCRRIRARSTGGQ